MKLYNTMRNLLVEAKFDINTAYNKLVIPNPKKPEQKPIMDFDTFKKLLLADPTMNVPENFDVDGASFEDLKKLQPGKFAEFLVKNYVKPKAEELEDIGTSDARNPEYPETIREFRRRYIEDLYRYKDILEKFPKYKQYLPQDKRDVNTVTPHELELSILSLPQEIHDKINRNLVKSTARETRKESKFAHPGSEIIFVGPNYTVTKIDSDTTEGQEAASYYGGYHDSTNGESNWCTSPPNSDYFKRYVKEGPIYNIFANDDKGKVGARTGLPQERYQFHFPTNQFKDRLNSSINIEELLNGPFAEFKDLFKQEFVKRLVNSEYSDKVFHLSLPSSSSLAKFVSIYGMDEVYNSIPKTIEEFKITNKASTPFYVDLSFLGRFKEVNGIHLENIETKIPDAICNLKKLVLVAFNDLPIKETLPECMADLPRLEILNLQGSDSLVIPPRLLDKIQSIDGTGGGFYFVV